MNPDPRTRRDFFRAAAASCLAAGGRAGATPAYRLGCYTRPWDRHDYRVAFDAIAEAGFRHAGLMTGKGGNSWVLINPELPIREARRMGTEARRRGLKLLSAYGDFPVRETAAQTVEGLDRLIDRCAEAGVPSLLLGGTTRPEHLGPYLRAVADRCDTAAGRDVGLCIKPHGGQNATGPQCRRAIQTVGHPNFRLWYDPGNIFYYSEGVLDPVDDAPTVNGLVVGMSAKDFLPPRDVNVTPGEGRVRFPEVLARLARGGFTSGPLMVETLKAGDVAEVTAQARRARERLEAWLRAPWAAR